LWRWIGRVHDNDLVSVHSGSGTSTGDDLAPSATAGNKIVIVPLTGGGSLTGHATSTGRRSSTRKMLRPSIREVPQDRLKNEWAIMQGGTAALIAITRGL
jgi:hypothetical protein